MRAHRIAAVVVRQYYLLRGSPARILPLFAWVAIDVVLWAAPYVAIGTGLYLAARAMNGGRGRA